MTDYTDKAFIVYKILCSVDVDENLFINFSRISQIQKQILTHRVFISSHWIYITFVGFVFVSSK